MDQNEPENRPEMVHSARMEHETCRMDQKGAKRPVAIQGEPEESALIHSLLDEGTCLSGLLGDPTSRPLEP